MTKRLVWMLGLGVSVLCGCVGSSPVPEENNTVPASRTGLVSADKNDYPVFPNSDEGADPHSCILQGRHDAAKPFAVRVHVEAALGGHLIAALRDDHGHVRAGGAGQGDHLIGGGHLEIHSSL